MYSPKIQKLIELFSRFPGIGPKTAARFVFFLTRNSKSENQEFAKAISALKEIKICKFCRKFHQENNELCSICSNKARHNGILCIIEKETDLVTIENTNLYPGLYFILGASLLALKKQGLAEERINEARKKIKNPQNFGLEGKFKEIILALNPTPQGETTALFLERTFSDLAKITRLGRGLPIGGEIEYADRETILLAFSNRK